jgi:signal transduction histidine kinase/CHASE2 domain-containing sensor protein
MRQWRLSYSLITLALTLLFMVLYAVGATKAVDYLFLDAFFQMRGKQPDQGDIVLVKLDEDFVKAYPFRIGELDRGFYARVIENLKLAGAKVIALDVFFPERSSLGRTATRNPDVELAEAISTSNVVLPLVRLEDNDDTTAPFLAPNVLLKDAKQGVILLEETSRSFTPVFTFPEGIFPSFAFATLEGAGLKATRNVNAPLLIDYRGPTNSFPTLSFLDVYRNQFSYSAVKDKIVLVGVTLTGTDRDQLLTPFGEMSGVEVNANEIYTLLHGRLATISLGLYLVLLLAVGVFAPVFSRRKRGLWYMLVTIAATFVLAFLLFRLGTFMSPLWLALLPAIAYLRTSYRHLLKLDTQLSKSLIQLLDSATLTDESKVTPTQLSQGFAPRGYATYAPDMLESLITGLGAKGGRLLLEQIPTEQGEVSEGLTRLSRQAIEERRTLSEGTFPYHIAEPITLDNKVVGAVALTLTSPPPPHLLSLLTTSVQTFSQLARYQKLRERTTSFTGTLFPWRARTSLDKLEALSMVSDLIVTERGWLGALVESLPQAVFIMSPYGYSVYKNAAARRLFGDEKNMLAAIPQMLRLERERFQHDYAVMVERGEELEFGLTERNTERPVLLTLRVVESGGEIKGVAGVVSDLSKVEELDRQRQEMIGMVVHDLRSPLTSIQGFAELMLAEAEGEKREFLDIIKSESQRMKRMTDVFLDVVRLENERFELFVTSTNLAELLRYAVGAVSYQASQKNIVIAVKAAAFLEANLDADLVSRLMVNLLTNAIKYSPEKTRITATLNQDDDDVRLEITDEGYGMTEEQCKSLFQKYQRTDEAKARRIVGTGLGLYLVKLICDAHKGRVIVTSELKKGSTFQVTLPLKQEVTKQEKEETVSFAK